MKKINKLLLTLLTGFLFINISCSDLSKNKTEKAYITFSQNIARTIQPTVISELYELNYELIGSFASKEMIHETYESYDDLTDAYFEVEIGSWDFELKCYKDEDLVASCSKSIETIAGNNKLDFEIPLSSLDFVNGKGSIDISLNVPDSVKTIKTKLFDSEDNYLSEYDDSIVKYYYTTSYEIAEINAGSYYVQFYLYDEYNNLLQIIEESINVAYGMASSDMITLGEEDLNPVYQIIYKLNGGEWKTNTSVIKGFTRFTTDLITLPSADLISKTDNAFVEWQDDDGNVITKINPAVRKDVTVHAVWTNSFNCTSENFAEITTALKNGPVYIKLTDVTNENIATIGTALKSSKSPAPKVYLDLSECTFTEISEEAFYCSNMLAGLELPETVTKIGNSAFKSCSNLTAITIPDSVTEIGKYAFEYCSSITNLTIPENVTTMGEKIVYGCSDLTTINYNAKNCSDFDSITYPFYGTSNNIELIIGEDVENIPANLARNSKIAKVTFNENGKVTRIGGNAFVGLTNLKTIEIPETVTNLGSHIVGDCTSLEKVYFNAINCTSTYTELMWSSTTAAEGFEIIFGEKVISIPGQLCNGNKNITSITIPDNVKVLGSDAFRECPNLTEVTIGKGVTDIKTYVFYGCSKLSKIYFNAENASFTGSYASIELNSHFIRNTAESVEVIFGDTVKSIPNGLFFETYIYDDEDKAKTPKINKITLGNNVEKIGEYSFYGLGLLTKIHIPASVKEIGTDAFENCNNLTEMTFEDESAIWVVEEYNYNNEVISTTEYTNTELHAYLIADKSNKYNISKKEITE